MSVVEYEVGRQPGPPTRDARRGRPDHAARPRRRLPRDRQGDGGRALPDELLVDHPRVRGSRRRHLRRAGPRALRVGLDADAHRLAALVHPRLPPPPRGRRSRTATSSSTTTRTSGPRTRRTSPSRCRSSARASCSASRPSPRTCSTSAARSPASTPTRSTSTPRRSSTTRLRWYRRGELNEDLDRMIFDNVRTETMNRGDMNAMLAACQLGEERFLRLLERYGVDVVMSAAYDWMDYSERMLRERDREDPRRRVRPRRSAGSTTTRATATCGCASRRR